MPALVCSSSQASDEVEHIKSSQTPFQPHLRTKDVTSCDKNDNCPRSLPFHRLEDIALQQSCSAFFANQVAEANGQNMAALSHQISAEVPINSLTRNKNNNTKAICNADSGIDEKDELIDVEND